LISTSLANFIRLVFNYKIILLPLISGAFNTISLSKRPNLRKAGSNVFGLLVAAITTVWLIGLTPSINVSNWDTTLFSTSPYYLSLLPPITSISSINITALPPGLLAASLAASNT